MWAACTSAWFAEVVTRAVDIGGDTDPVAAVAGGIAGTRSGITAIPSRWAAYVQVNMHSAHPKAIYGLEDLHNLTYGLMGTGDQLFQDPDPIGPAEIEDGMYAASLTGAEQAPNDWAIVPMRRTRGRLNGHRYRRAFHIVDKNGFDNDMRRVGTEAVDAVGAFVAEGRNIVVHCQTGNSPTGLVMRAWLMHRQSWSGEQALAYIVDRWGHVGLLNDDFTRFLRGEWMQEVPE